MSIFLPVFVLAAGIAAIVVILVLGINALINRRDKRKADALWARESEGQWER